MGDPASVKYVRMKDSRTVIAVCWAPGCPDVSGHVEIDVERRLWFCHRCGRGGKLRRMPRLEGGNDWSPLQPMRALTRDGLQDMRPGLRKRRVSTYRPTDRQTAYWDYLVGRGLDEDHIRDLQPHTGPNPWFVYFPVYDQGGTVTAYVGRAIMPARKRYDTEIVIPGVSFVWGLHRVKLGPGQRLVLVEGLFDAVWSKDRLAMRGTSLARGNLDVLLSLKPRKLIIALDATARAEARRTAGLLAHKTGLPVWVAFPPGRKDPDDMRNDDRWLKDATRCV